MNLLLKLRWTVFLLGVSHAVSTYGDVKPQDRLPGLGDSKKRVEKLIGAPVAKGVFENREDREVFQHRVKTETYTLIVQVVYMDETAAHLTFHLVSPDGGKNLPWKKEQLALLRLASHEDDDWKQIEHDGPHIRFRNYNIYAPQ